MFAPRQIPEEQRLNKRQRAVVLIMNVLLLCELTVSMYIGQQDPDNLTTIFLKFFVPLCVATLIGARLMMRRLQSPQNLTNG